MTALSGLDQATQSFAHVASLRGRVIYLAHPIDLARISPAQAERMTRLARGLHAAGAVVYDPASAFTIGKDVSPGPAVYAINRAAMQTADCLVACYPETPGVGVSMEIQMAESMQMPSVILTDAIDVSWSLAGLEYALLSREVGRDQLAWLAEEAAEYVAARTGRTVAQPDPIWFACERPDLLPVRKHHDDAGFDLFVSETTTVPVGATVDVPCGVAAQLPDGVWCMVVGRSSTSRAHGLLVHPGIIDTGYRGPLFAQIENRGEAEFVAQEGARLAQMIPLPNLAQAMQAVPTVALQPSQRGLAGFGSTGV